MDEEQIQKEIIRLQKEVADLWLTIPKEYRVTVGDIVEKEIELESYCNR